MVHTKIIYLFLSKMSRAKKSKPNPYAYSEFFREAYMKTTASARILCGNFLPDVETTSLPVKS